MNSLAEFVTLVHEELGIEVTVDTVGKSWDDVPGWDSVHLITLLSLLERETRRPVSLPDMLEAGSLKEVYDLAGGGR
ncbi:acyl carrier protein [Streptomyces sp. NPDC057307]|uniref:acyl carrier protein n=1 Tax=Streptomyces sp. NPDC057307 TaxID=3346096 RepID=UPI003624CE4E